MENFKEGEGKPPYMPNKKDTHLGCLLLFSLHLFQQAPVLSCS
ncbi:hypothetical protein CHCC20491_1801 [Bacillus paralicheniformis]|nr:hypothetical protein CHCC20491_1801 [Bacillus paralicheniformis]